MDAKTGSESGVVESTSSDAAAAAIEKLKQRSSSGGPDDRITTAAGVVIGLRKPTGANLLLSAELSGMSPMLAPMVEALLCVAQVNGNPQPTIRSRNQIDNLANTIGRDGVQEVIEWYNNIANPEIEEARRRLGDDASPADIGTLATQIRIERTKK